MDIQGFWKAVIAQDADKIRPFFHPDAYVNWHNTNERFSAEEFIRANCEYPGKWKGEVERILDAGEQIVTAAHVYSEDGTVSCHVASFICVRDGKIISLDEYWGDDGPPPQWRVEMRLGTEIKG